MSDNSNADQESLFQSLIDWPRAEDETKHYLDSGLIEGQASAQISRSLNLRKTVCIVGAGVNAAYGLANWEDLVTAVFSILMDRFKTIEEKHTNTRDKLRKAELLKSNLEAIGLDQGAHIKNSIDRGDFPVALELCERLSLEISQLETPNHYDEAQAKAEFRAVIKRHLSDTFGSVELLLSQIAKDVAKVSGHKINSDEYKKATPFLRFARFILQKRELKNRGDVKPLSSINDVPSLLAIHLLEVENWIEKTPEKPFDSTSLLSDGDPRQGSTRVSTALNQPIFFYVKECQVRTMFLGELVSNAKNRLDVADRLFVDVFKSFVKKIEKTAHFAELKQMLVHFIELHGADILSRSFDNEEGKKPGTQIGDEDSTTSETECNLLNYLEKELVIERETKLAAKVQYEKSRQRRRISPEHRDPLGYLLDGLKIDRFITTNYDTELERLLATRGYLVAQESDSFGEDTNGAKNVASISTINILGARGQEFVLGDNNSSDLVDFGTQGRDGRIQVFHIHGRATTDSDIVLTETDYRKLYLSEHRDFGAKSDALQLTFSSNPLLFIGTSMEEHDVLRPLRAFMGRNMRLNERPAISLMPAFKDESKRRRQKMQLMSKYGVYTVHFGFVQAKIVDGNKKTITEARCFLEELSSPLNEITDTLTDLAMACRSRRKAIESREYNKEIQGEKFEQDKENDKVDSTLVKELEISRKCIEKLINITLEPTINECEKKECIGVYIEGQEVTQFPIFLELNLIRTLIKESFSCLPDGSMWINSSSIKGIGPEKLNANRLNTLNEVKLYIVETHLLTLRKLLQGARSSIVTAFLTAKLTSMKTDWTKWRKTWARLPVSRVSSVYKLQQSNKVPRPYYLQRHPIMLRDLDVEVALRPQNWMASDADAGKAPEQKQSLRNIVLSDPPALDTDRFFAGAPSPSFLNLRGALSRRWPKVRFTKTVYFGALIGQRSRLVDSRNNQSATTVKRRPNQFVVRSPQEGRRVFLLLADRGLGKGQFYAAMRASRRFAEICTWLQLCDYAKPDGPTETEEIPELKKAVSCDAHNATQHVHRAFFNLGLSNEVLSIFDKLREFLQQCFLIWRERLGEATQQQLFGSPDLVKQDFMDIKNDRIASLQLLLRRLTEISPFLSEKDRIIVCLNHANVFFEKDGRSKNAQVQILFETLISKRWEKAKIDFIFLMNDLLIPAHFKEDNRSKLVVLRDPNTDLKTEIKPTEICFQHLYPASTSEQDRTIEQRRFKNVGLRVWDPFEEDISQNQVEPTSGFYVHALKRTRPEVFSIRFFPLAAEGFARIVLSNEFSDFEPTNSYTVNNISPHSVNRLLQISAIGQKRMRDVFENNLKRAEDNNKRNFGAEVDKLIRRSLSLKTLLLHKRDYSSKAEVGYADSVYTWNEEFHEKLAWPKNDEWNKVDGFVDDTFDNKKTTLGELEIAFNDLREALPNLLDRNDYGIEYSAKERFEKAMQLVEWRFDDIRTLVGQSRYAMTLFFALVSDVYESAIRGSAEQICKQNYKQSGSNVQEHLDLSSSMKRADRFVEPFYNSLRLLTSGKKAASCEEIVIEEVLKFYDQHYSKYPVWPYAPSFIGSGKVRIVVADRTATDKEEAETGERTNPQSESTETQIINTDPNFGYNNSDEEIQDIGIEFKPSNLKNSDLQEYENTLNLVDARVIAARAPLIMGELDRNDLLCADDDQRILNLIALIGEEKRLEGKKEASSEDSFSDYLKRDFEIGRRLEQAPGGLVSNVMETILVGLALIGQPTYPDVIVCLPDVRNALSRLMGAIGLFDLASKWGGFDEAVNKRRDGLMQYTLLRILDLMVHRCLAFRVKGKEKDWNEEHNDLTRDESDTEQDSGKKTGVLPDFRRGKTRFAVHKSIRRHIHAKIDAPMVDFSDVDQLTVSMYATQPNDLPCPSLTAHQSIKSIVDNLIGFEKTGPTSLALKNPEFRLDETPQDVSLEMSKLRAAYGIIRSVYSVGVIAGMNLFTGMDDNTPKDGHLEEHFARVRWMTQKASDFAGLYDKARDQPGGKKFTHHFPTANPNPFYGEEVAWLYNESAVIKLVQGHLGDAAALFERAQRAAQRFVEARNAGPLTNRISLSRALCDIERGAAKQGRKRLEHILTFDDEHESVKSIAHGYLGLLDQLAGNNDLAQQRYQEAIDRLQRMSRNRAASIFCRHHADLLRTKGTPDCNSEALQYVNKAINLASNGRHEDVRYLALLAKIRIQTNEIGSSVDPKNLFERLDEVESYAIRAGIPRITAEVYLARAEIQNKTGDYKDALRSSAHALDISNRYDMQLRKISATIEMAGIFYVNDRPHEATPLLQRAMLMASKAQFFTARDNADSYLNDQGYSNPASSH